ncbi:hypothetical protein [Nostoc sp.]|uniref:hypothetical protein n=1 Tax=Nostoc sp. TaxID=1180 RepID=UPI002FFC70AD
MTKQQISSSSKLVDARSLAIYGLDQFIHYIRSLDPELTPSEATVIAAITLQKLPELFLENPSLAERAREMMAMAKPKHPTKPNVR